jgi:hypothetical protein
MEDKSAILEKPEFKALGSEEYIEISRDNAGNKVFGFTGFPSPKKRYEIVYEAPNLSIEEMYYWILEHFKVSQAHPDVIKIQDIFSASEQSSFFGSAQQRIGLQQEKVSMFLATIGKMVKELFQLVREIRILKERLNYYEDSFDEKSRSRESAEISLKGIWIDLVEQGAKNPASVYGMARELQFTTLPDLFFSIHPTSAADVDTEVDKLDFNRKVKEVLKRKLRQFYEWKRTSHDELKNRHVFTLKYLRQHFDIIKMYMSWVKPYLRNIRRMQSADRSSSPHLISAFEGSVIELEFLAYRFPTRQRVAEPIRRNQEIYSVVIAHFYYRTKPQMSYSQEYQRGPLHVGMCDMTLRAYAWTKEQIRLYEQYRAAEDLDLMTSIDGSVKAAMEALGEEFERYLKEAGETEPIKKEKKIESLAEKMKKSADPFTAIIFGFGEVFGSFGKKKGKKGLDKVALEGERKAAEDSAGNAIWQTYKNYKKMEGMIAW